VLSTLPLTQAPFFHLGRISLVCIEFHAVLRTFLIFLPQVIRDHSYGSHLGPSVLIDGHELRET
jgi:hypothetical protein